MNEMSHILSTSQTWLGRCGAGSRTCARTCCADLEKLHRLCLSHTNSWSRRTSTAPESSRAARGYFIQRGMLQVSLLTQLVHPASATGHVREAEKSPAFQTRDPRFDSRFRRFPLISIDRISTSAKKLLAFVAFGK